MSWRAVVLSCVRRLDALCGCAPVVVSPNLCLNGSSDRGEGRACLVFWFVLGFQAEQRILSCNLAATLSKEKMFCFC